MNEEKLSLNSLSLSNDLLVEIPIENISLNPFQPRRHFAEEELKELVESIQSVGLLHPPLVRPLDDGTYELISGERRLRAVKMLGMTSIPVVVRQSSHATSAQAALIENIQRVDLNPLEVAKALRALIEEFGFQQDILAQKLGKNRSTVSNYLRMLTLPKNIQDSISTEIISMGHAKAILSLEGFEKQNLLHELILRDDLNVREAEEAAQRISQKAKKQTLTYVNRDFYLEQLSERLQQKLGTKVHIEGKGKKGRISITYYSLDDLDRLLALFGC